MLEDKIYTLEEMRSLDIDTHEYVFMDQPGETTGMLMLKAESVPQAYGCFSPFPTEGRSLHRSFGGSWAEASKTSPPERF